MKSESYFKRDKIILICDRIIEFCLYLVIFTSIFSKAAVEIFFCIAFMAYLLRKVLGYFRDGRKIVLPLTKLDLPLLAFISANIISVILSQNFIISLKNFFTTLFENLLFYLMILEIILSKENDKKKFFISVILIASLAIVIAAISQYFMGRDIFRHFAMSGRRLTASIGSPNTFSAWLILVTPLFCCWGIMGKIKNSMLRIVLLTLSCLLIFCIFLTYSRAAWLGLAGGILFIAAFKDKKMILFFLAVVIFFALFILFYPNSMAEFKTEYAKYHILIRLNLWKEAVSLIKDYPFFGVGLKNYLAVIPKYQIHKFNIPITQIGETTGISPHNGYLQMAAEIGLVGLSCFLWLLWTLFQNGIKSLKAKLDPVLLGLLSGLLAFLTSAFFDNHLNKVELSAMFWIILALVTGLLKKNKILPIENNP